MDVQILNRPPPAHNGVPRLFCVEFCVLLAQGGAAYFEETQTQFGSYAGITLCFCVLLCLHFIMLFLRQNKCAIPPPSSSVSDSRSLCVCLCLSVSLSVSHIVGDFVRNRVCVVVCASQRVSTDGAVQRKTHTPPTPPTHTFASTGRGRWNCSCSSWTTTHTHSMQQRPPHIQFHSRQPFSISMSR